MSHTTHTGIEYFDAAFDALSERCRTLGVPLWRFDTTGIITAWPLLPDPLRRWVAGDLFRSRLESCGRMALITKRMDPTQLFPGATLVPMEEREGGARFGLVVAVVFTSEILGENRLFDGFANAGQMRQDMIPLVRSNIEHRDQLIATVRWSFADLLRSSRDTATLEQFGEKLSQAYEETALLFRLSRLLSCVSDPANLVKTFCTQVHEIMPFGWLAIRFDPRHTELRELANQLVIAGTPPCSTEQLDRAAVQVVQSWGGDDWTRVLHPRRQRPWPKCAPAKCWPSPLLLTGK